MNKTKVKEFVRERYARVAQTQRSCCQTKETACCPDASETISRSIGYSEEDLKAVPEGSNLGLGCGNPLAIANLKPGETVLDLGSGAGFDCFLAANKVGPGGRVIGLDMTPEMIEKARTNAARQNYGNVEFRLGEIEDIPVEDKSVDVIISNCVINLSPDKPQVFREAFRVLRPGGRMMISDIVLTRELPALIRESIEAYVGCVAGAMLESDYLAVVRKTGFEDVRITGSSPFSIDMVINDPEAMEILSRMKLSVEEAASLAGTILSIHLLARKPSG